MHLKQLKIFNFKNIETAEFELAEKVNCFLGNNGSGKTTVLDSIYYLAFCKSFFNPIDSQNIQYDSEFFMIDGDFDFAGESERINCAQKRGEKKRFKRNQKEYDRLADHIGMIPLVMIAPSDTDLIREGSEMRRKFMNGIISQYNRGYLDTLLQYNRTLAQRNAMLKHIWVEGKRMDQTVFEVFDEQLHALGTDIYQERVSFLKDYLPIFSNFYQLISGGAEEVTISYESHLNEKPLKDWFAETRQNDLRAHFTTKGIHKDDLVFQIGDHQMKKFGSQGQQKSFVIALRLAQFDYLKDLKQRKPILLLDDIFDKLDDLRVGALMKLVSEDHFGQIFITDANLHRVPELFKDEKIPLKKFIVERGSITDF
ncbi:MAG TPA: DNA replication and repair protein RecF [Flavobacteriales bacterium]|jgi:DNA replication and repair protein RecF|nr:DNA replication/repair protein RecF [Flavobacteriales bacterium]HAW20036.1 DNA replication and repair protein RecF [Flavobacteriales bacterium]